MEEKNRPSISEWIRTNSSVSKVSAELNISRPTVYKYIERYDAGDYGKLPESVIAYFEQRLSNDGPRRIDEVKKSLKDEVSVLTAKIRVESEHIESILARKKDLEYQMNSLKSEIRETAGNPELENTLNEYQRVHEVLSTESLTYEESLTYLKRLLDEKTRMLTEYEHMEYVPAEGRDVFKIKSSCYIENNRCMVVHTGDDYHDDEGLQNHPEDRKYYRLHLYSKIGNEFAHLGEYKSVSNRNFFIIDDVVLSAPLYYNIVECVVDPQFNEWTQLKDGEEPPLVETSGANCTGICELKQMK